MDKILSIIKMRVLDFLKEKGVKIGVFHAETGISASNFKGKGAGSELGGDKIVKILTQYPDLSAEWLLRGEGEIFKTKSIENVRDLNPNENPNKIPNKRKVQETLGYTAPQIIYQRDPQDIKLIASLERNVALQDEVSARDKAEIASLKRRISDLESASGAQGLGGARPSIGKPTPGISQSI
jgi:hypothetical protein